MITALIILQILDALTTYWSLRLGGYERNPILKKLAIWLKGYTNAKWAWLVVAKAVGIAASWLVVLYAPHEVIYGLIIFYALILVNNVAVIDKLRR